MASVPLSLYFGLPKGEHADLEVIARASLEWVEIVRDLASVIAPDAEIEIEFVQTEEGSVWLQNMVKAVKHGDKKAMRALAIAAILFFALGPALHLQQDFGDGFWEFFGHDHDEAGELSDKEKEWIVAAVVEAIEKTEIEDRRRRVVRQVEQDDAITSIGVSTTPRREGPISRISREQFPAYGAHEPKERPKTDKDTELRNRVRVKIIRASLRPGETRPRWRFQEGDTEWSADIEDQEFICAVNADQTGLHLAVGQEMVVDIAIDRKFVDGAWEEDRRRITRVRYPSIERQQSSLWPDD